MRQIDGTQKSKTEGFPTETCYQHQKPIHGNGKPDKIRAGILLMGS